MKRGGLGLIVKEFKSLNVSLEGQLALPHQLILIAFSNLVEFCSLARAWLFFLERNVLFLLVPTALGTALNCPLFPLNFMYLSCELSHHGLKLLL